MVAVHWAHTLGPYIGPIHRGHALGPHSSVQGHLAHTGAIHIGPSTKAGVQEPSGAPKDLIMMVLEKILSATRSAIGCAKKFIDLRTGASHRVVLS